MHPVLNAYLSQAIVSDWREEAERLAYAGRTGRGSRLYDAVTVRLARGNDAGAVRRLAELDGRHAPEGPMLVAEVHGELLAARSLSGEGSIADPFHPTAHLIELLELRSAHLRNGFDAGHPQRRGARRWLRGAGHALLTGDGARGRLRAAATRRRTPAAPADRGEGRRLRSEGGNGRGCPVAMWTATAPGRVEVRRRERVSAAPAPPGAATVRVPARRPARQLLISRRRRQRQRIDVRMSATGPPHAEVEVRLRRRALPAGPHLADLPSRADRLAALDGGAPQMEVARYMQSVSRSDRDRDPGRAERAGESHRARPRGGDAGPDPRRDVDAAMHPARVRTRVVVRARGDDRAAHRPEPSLGRARGGRPPKPAATPDLRRASLLHAISSTVGASGLLRSLDGSDRP